MRTVDDVPLTREPARSLTVSEPRRMLLVLPYRYVEDGSVVIAARVGLTPGHALRRARRAVARLERARREQAG